MIQSDNQLCSDPLSMIPNDNQLCSDPLSMIQNDNQLCSDPLSMIQNDNQLCAVVIRYQRFSMVISSLYPLLTTQQSNNKNFNQLSKIQKRVIYILICYQRLRMVTDYI